MKREEFIEKIKRAGIERDEEKRIYIAGVLNEVLEEYGSRITVVGGSIVALFTAGYYTTADIDIVAKKPEKVNSESWDSKPPVLETGSCMRIWV